jgi:transposase
MPRPFPAEFRLRAVALVRAGQQITKTAQDLGVSAGALHKWVHQDKVDRGELPGTTTAESAELARARKRIRELETEVEVLRRAHQLMGKDSTHPKGSTR